MLSIHRLNEGRHGTKLTLIRSIPQGNYSGLLCSNILAVHMFAAVLLSLELDRVDCSLQISTNCACCCFAIHPLFPSPCPASLFRYWPSIDSVIHRGTSLSGAVSASRLEKILSVLQVRTATLFLVLSVRGGVSTSLGVYNQH